ncbi:hypothetical protein CHS0354_021517 [Potamilus streckersoni]|uniref:Major facilitator superfamily (MFS) profile domain-containing protein n=2 Tax=Potamilus streckersoni TaxID=2493646 RepID=A0AAE0VYV3_9BIVA|nr:hypothetical protein CHS0354_021517 [Potamilus streckersoni]
MCAIPNDPDDTFLIQGIHHQELINATIPAKLEDGEIVYSKCTYYMQEFNSSSYINDVMSSYFNINYSQPKAENACYKWVYDTSIFELTVVSEMDLVCDKKMYRAHSSMMYMVGYLVGVISMGILSDKIGRKNSYFISLVLITISAIITAWVPDFLLYVALQLLTGFADAGLFLSFYSLVIELVGPSKRAMMGAATHIMWVVGITLLCGIAFFIRHWRHLKMAISFPFVPLLVVWWFIPESPRWLMSKGRYDEAKVILKQMATFNGKDMPEMVQLSLKPGEKKTQIWHIFSTCGMAVRTIIVFLNWMMVSMLFYGLTLSVENLGGNMYLNFLIFCVQEAICYIISFVLMNKVGRKTFHCSQMLMGGIACVATIFPVIFARKSLQWLTTTLAVIGRFGAAAAFATIYIFTSELYPTVIRNSALGASSMWARIGALIAPYIAELSNVVEGDFGKALPLIIFGGSAVGAGLLALFLPETANTKLPEKLEDAKEIGRKSKDKRYSEDVQEAQLSMLKSNSNENRLQETAFR